MELIQDFDVNQIVRQTYTDLKKMKMRNAIGEQAKKLIVQPVNYYTLFNKFEMENNRFISMEQYQLLSGEIQRFNDELVQLKKDGVKIKNLYTTYYLYRNLFSRMKFVANLVIDRNQAQKAYKQIAKWFQQQKPKIRNKAPQKQQGQMRPRTVDCEDIEVDTMLQTTQIKRQLSVYDNMARTAHTDFFPPKDRLNDFRRKEVLEGLKAGGLQERRVSSTTNLTKKLRTASYKNSMATTRSTFKNTMTSFKKSEQERDQPNVVPFEIKQENEKEQKLYDEQFDKLEDIDKKVNQEELLQQNIIKPQHEQDVVKLGEEEELISEEEEKEEKPIKKKYTNDPNAEVEMMAEEKIKDSRQSTLRRILKEKQKAIKEKLEELDIKKHMNNWGAITSKRNTSQHRKLERLMPSNKYEKIAYRPKSFDERHSARKLQIPEFDLMMKPKSASQSIEKDIEKLKISNAVKKYGKYIRHVDIKTQVDNEEEEDQLKMLRATSLTAFTQTGKKKPFSSLVQNHDPEIYNEEMHENALKIKEHLAKKLISVEKNSIYNALTVVDTKTLEKVPQSQIHPIKKQMYPNPFFPKHLYQAKAKKKK